MLQNAVAYFVTWRGNSTVLDRPFSLQRMNIMITTLTAIVMRAKIIAIDKIRMISRLLLVPTTVTAEKYPIN